MALELSYDFKGGSAKYWKIAQLRQDYITGKTHIHLALYFDKASRDENVENTLTTIVRSKKDILSTRKDAYLEIKKPVMQVNPKTGVEEDTNMFTNAKDILET